LRWILGSYSPHDRKHFRGDRAFQIVVAQPCRAVSSLPAGFDYADIAVIEWIAAEGRRLSRGLLPM
jgi:hypothetical protein